MISVSATSGLVSLYSKRNYLDIQYPGTTRSKSSVVAMPHHKQTRRDLLHDSNTSLQQFRRYPYGMTLIRSLMFTASSRLNRDDCQWHGAAVCLLQVKKGSVVPINGHVGGPL